MKSVVELDINRSRERAATLFADPANNPKWMDDLARYEPLSGEPGMPGSTYRLVPKAGEMIFLAPVVSRDLPGEIRLSLDASNVTVSITARFLPLSAEKTRLISAEEFSFKGLLGKLVGFFAQVSIRKAHRCSAEFSDRVAGPLCVSSPPLTARRCGEPSRKLSAAIFPISVTFLIYRLRWQIRSISNGCLALPLSRSARDARDA